MAMPGIYILGFNLTRKKVRCCPALPGLFFSGGDAFTPSISAWPRHCRGFSFSRPIWNFAKEG